MAFPQTDLDTRIELLLAGVWTDVTTYVYNRDPIQITRGHPDEANGINPTVCSLTLNNRSGRFSPRNPLGPYFGNLGRNTQMRLSVPENGTYLRMEGDGVSYASCPDATRLHITGDLELQADMWLSDRTNSIIVSRYSLTVGNPVWSLSAVDDGTLQFFWSPSGPNPNVTVSSTVPLPLGRIAVKVTLAVATGTVTFYTAPTIAGPWTQLGAAVVVGATSLFSSTVPLVIGANADESSAANSGFNITPLKGANGKFYAVKVLNGIGGTVVASPTFTSLAAGTTSFSDAQTNAWTLSGTAEISDRKYRTHVEVPAWPPRWEASGADVYAPIQGAGRWRRLTAGTPPTYSALYRAYVRLTGTTAPVAYWPCEDGGNATALASGLPGAPAMTFTGTPSLSADPSFLCSAPLPTLGNSAWTGIVPTYTTPAGAANTLRFLMKIPSSSVPADGTVMASLFTFGTVVRTDLIFRSGGMQLKGYNSSNLSIFDSGVVAFSLLDQQYRYSVELQTSGGNVQWAMVVMAPGAPGALSASGTVAGTIGNAYKAAIAPGGGMAGVVAGHVSVQPVWDSLFNLGAPLNAWSGEKAGIRFARLCTEENIPCRIYGAPADTVAMGTQTSKDVPSLLQECEDADKGLIYEPRQAFGIGYRTRASMFNQAPAVALSYSAAQLAEPMEPTDDDRLIANDVTVMRSSGGSSARQSLTSGALSTQAPPNGVGPYQQTPTVNLATDSQLADQAGWLVWLGTVDDLRYPVLSANLASPKAANVYYQLQDLDIGDRIVVGSTPSWLPPDGISQIVQGQTEQCYDLIFTEQWSCAPELPYRVGILDDPVLGHADTDGSTVHAGISATATSMQVDTIAGSPLWTTSGGDFPFDIAVGGERMTVTNITGASSPQTFTVTRSVNGVVKAQTAGTDVRLWQPMILSM
jgi:hypothetical protein